MSEGDGPGKLFEDLLQHLLDGAARIAETRRLRDRRMKYEVLTRHVDSLRKLFKTRDRTATELQESLEHSHREFFRLCKAVQERFGIDLSDEEPPKPERTTH